MNNIYIISALRTSIGDFGGYFKSLSSLDLIVPVIDKTIENAGIEKNKIGKVIIGNTLSPITPNIARGAAIKSKIPPETPSFSIHCACASSMQAFLSGASALMLGETDVALVGGVESMSNAPYLLSAERWGKRLRHAEATDLLWWSMQDDPIMGGMGLAADFIAQEFNISREEQDELSALSHQRACRAINEAYFKSQIIPIEINNKKSSQIIDTDQHPRPDAVFENLSKLRPAFTADGTVTAGNASSLNDGAAAIIMATAHACDEYGLKPLAKVGSWSIKAAEPKLTGIAPVPAIREVLNKEGLQISDLELIELNEAFASYYIACEKELKLDRSRVNVNGSGISLGHPVGATGSRLVVTLLHEMIRRDVGQGLASLCAGGGMGYAVSIQRNF